MSYNEDLQNNNDALRGILGDVKALPDGTGGVQPDYEQNDPAARDYIKNRPFYDSREWVAVHTEAETSPSGGTPTGQEYSTFAAASPNIFELYPVGTTVRCVIDGAEYVSVIRSDYAIGNYGLVSGGIDDPTYTGEDFCLFAFGSSTIDVCVKDKPAGAYKVSVYALEGELEKIGAKFLPEPVQADWNQNDPAAPGYIKNRPFHAESDRRVPVFENIETSDYASTLSCFTEGKAFFDQYPSGTTVRFVIDGREYVGPITDGDHVGNLSLYQPSQPDTGEEFCLKRGPGVMIVAERGTPGGQHTVSISVLEPGAVEPIDPKFLPVGFGNGKPLILDASSSDYYGGYPEAGDEALEAIKTGRQILVRVPNASGDNYAASYSPIYFYQLPQNGQYLYVFYLKDEKQDLSALLGQPAGTVVMPTYGELMMLLSQHYDSNPLEG